MHLLRSKQRSREMESKPRGRGKPKFERQNALRNVVYRPFTPSYDDSEGLRAVSFDPSSLEDRTSFRVEGIDGIDEICRRLGLSGPEEFEIPVSAWEGLHSRSLPALFPRSQLPQLECYRNQDEQEQESHPDVQAFVVDEDEVKVSNVYETQNTGVELNTRPIAVESSGAGIKGSRPIFLAPPPSISLRITEHGSSAWDILRSFGPDSNGRTSQQLLDGSSEEDEASGMTNLKAEVSGVRLGETAVLSESCSFTASSDDDWSSTTTAPMLNISPVRRCRPSISRWEKGEILGSGSFGMVYEGIADDGFFFALKEVSLVDQGSQGKQCIIQLEQEIALLSQFEHENIVQYYGTYKDESKFCIFLELVSKGSLRKLYQQYTLQDSHACAYTRQILLGLKYLHDQNVVHRDIKCANILVDTNGSVKLADFGLAKATKLNDVKSCKGTPFWMAPEVVNGKNCGYGLSADIWSLGCTVLEMLTRQIPYSHLESMQAMYRIGKGEAPPISESLSKDACDFIQCCLRVDPSHRPTAAQLLDHPFVRRPQQF